ncbi:acetyl-CoA hydrolase/transferase C-terminal domain-containing protein [Pseudonocardia sp. TRM90224]|uniref:acetyl-CoA hydrolase/transferase C-terminal domain-containing protein n=1 Tax=Pseudonocardia sp. TRM90224 TaxID=2812678 RepID=UPI001E45449D|nr:acetyl-CoA hydrolase/transferase C-terminal domain-containing protein [Pseudonocardia sp. TRM90224]
MAAIDDLVRPGMRVAVADGTGTPRALFGRLAAAAARVGGVGLVMGWTPHPEPGLDHRAFADARTVMSGWGLRSAIADGAVRSVPTRLSAVPALLAGPLRPDLLVAGLVRGDDGLRFGSEVSWMRGLVAAGVPVAAVVSRGAPHADAGPPLPEDGITVLDEVDDPPREVRIELPGEVEKAIARHVVALVPEGARVQVGPGRIGSAVLGAVEVPVRVDSGLLPEPIVDLDERGLLIDAFGAYMVGTRRLYSWAHDRPLLHPLEITHDPARLCAADPAPLIACNTAVEIDLAGQVNVEGTASALVGGVGGHPDYAEAGVRCPDGLSIVALASRHRGRSTLVERLSRPVTTASHDVDVVVTERGRADLRGMDRAERTAALRALWGER